MANKVDLLRKAVEFFNSKLWTELIGKEKAERLVSLRARLEAFETVQDKQDKNNDCVRGQIHEIKEDFKLKEIYQKELDILLKKQGGE